MALEKYVDRLVRIHIWIIGIVVRIKERDTLEGLRANQRIDAV